VAYYLKVKGVLLILSLLFCFSLSYLSAKIGLATIVGAFAAGLILEDVFYRDFIERGEHELTHMLGSLTTFLVPIFFVRMGMIVDLSVFGQTSIIVFAIALTIAAIIGKQICSLGVLEKGLDRISVGIGMIPRGEVGLIVASIGLSQLVFNNEPVISKAIYSAVVIMVMITTMVTPPVLKITLHRGEMKKAKLAMQSEQKE